MTIEIKILRRGEGAILANAAPGVFDDPLVASATEEFLGDPRHHLAVAVEDGVVIGFASAVHYVHPDKARPELWVNEVGVAPSHQGRGLGKAVLSALLAAGRAAGCAEAWVLTERSNPRALRLYAALGGVEAKDDAVMFAFSLNRASDAPE